MPYTEVRYSASGVSLTVSVSDYININEYEDDGNVPAFSSYLLNMY